MATAIPGSNRQRPCPRREGPAFASPDCGQGCSKVYPRTADFQKDADSRCSRTDPCLSGNPRFSSISRLCEAQTPAIPQLTKRAISPKLVAVDALCGGLRPWRLPHYPAFSIRQTAVTVVLLLVFPKGVDLWSSAYPSHFPAVPSCA